MVESLLAALVAGLGLVPVYIAGFMSGALADVLTLPLRFAFAQALFDLLSPLIAGTP